VRRSLDESLLLRLDKDGDGVDRLEFVTGTLVDLGLVSERALAAVLKRFDELDTDKSGFLSPADFAPLKQQVIQKRRDRASRQSSGV
jgi:hypothetical protein